MSRIHRALCRIVAAGIAISVLAPVARATKPERVLVVVNRGSAMSKEIGAYYATKRQIPAANICRIRAPREEQISRRAYDEWVEPAVRKCLESGDAHERIDYIVTTKGVPLKIGGTAGASVDSELTLLYGKINGAEFPLEGKVPNPFYRQSSFAFSKDRFGIYLVTRLTGFNLDDVKALIDRAQLAENRGTFVLDGTSWGHEFGERQFRSASRILPGERVHFDTIKDPVYDVKDVIGYASWGSNDKHRVADGRRDPGLEWLPGGIATEYVSSDARTFEEPPEDWRPVPWAQREGFWKGSPQSLTADFIRQGATGASGHVFEPKLDATPNPEILFPAYLQGRTLAESFYLSIRYLSWMNVVVGDPLCSLGPPE